MVYLSKGIRIFGGLLQISTFGYNDVFTVLTIFICIVYIVIKRRIKNIYYFETPRPHSFYSPMLCSGFSRDKGKGKAKEEGENLYPAAKVTKYESDSDSEFERQINRAKLESMYKDKVGESSTSNQGRFSYTSNKAGESSTSSQIGKSTENE